MNSKHERASVVASLTEAPTEASLARLPAAVDWLEVRADLVGDLSVPWLREHTDKGLLFTLRSSAEGGAGETSLGRRQARLLEAAAGYDLVDLEGERDLTKEILASLPPEQRLISWHGTAPDAEALLRRLTSLSRTPARYYKLVVQASQHGEELVPLRLLLEIDRTDVAAFAMGALGSWTRLIAPRLGAPLVFASWGDVPAAPGQIPAEALIADYGLPALPPVERLFGLIGNPVGHSLSPRLHNRAYRELGLPYLYLPFHAEVFGDFWLETVESDLLAELGLPFGGFSVTAPHKPAALAVSAVASPLAETIGAANTLYAHADGVWQAEVTDPEGIVGPLLARGIALPGKRAAVVGAGGAGRSAVIGLKRAGARGVLVNRSTARGLEAARELGVPFVPLADFDPSAFDLVVNATSLGRDAEGPLPFEPSELGPGVVVVDMVYTERPTRLIEAVRAAGGVGIDGREVLLYQAAEQFRLLTDRPLPVALGRRWLGLEDPLGEDPR